MGGLCDIETFRDCGVNGMGNQVTATPSANEVAVILEVLNVFNAKNISYKQAILLLPSIEEALQESALSQNVRKACPRHQSQ